MVSRLQKISKSTMEELVDYKGGPSRLGARQVDYTSKASRLTEIQRATQLQVTLLVDYSKRVSRLHQLLVDYYMYQVD